MPGSLALPNGRHKGIEVLPDAVRRARQEAGLSLAQVAEGEVTRAAIHMVETGKMRPSMRTLQLIARKTKRPISYFLSGGGATEEQRRDREEIERLVTTEDFAGAIELGERVLEERPPPGIEADVRFFLGRAYVRTGDGQRARPHLVQAREFFEEARDLWMTAEALDQEACALHLLGDPRTIARALQALDACEQIKPTPPALLVRIHLNLGSHHYRINEWERARRFYERGLELASLAPNIRLMAALHGELGLTQQRLGNFSSALSHARKSHSLYAGSMDITNLVRAEANLGEILLMQGELDAAAPHLKRALQLCDERGLGGHFKLPSLTTLAELHIARGEFDEAEPLLHEVTRAAQAQGGRPHLATALRLSGRFRLKSGDLEVADQLFTAAIAMFQALHQDEELSESHAEYAEALGAQGRLEEAIEHWRAAMRSTTLSKRAVAAAR
jgi:tetratricopeptide (TPR) repeat protein